MIRIDLNSDMGESYGAWCIPGEEMLATHITSANVACGFHAGDPRVMERTVQELANTGVAIGAHPGYPDRVGFGRREMRCTPDEIRTDVLYQIGALTAFCRSAGVPLHHVKPHGALYNQAAADPEIAAAIIAAIADGMDAPLVYAQAGSALARAAEPAGVRLAAEGFADRAYLADGRLASRSLPGAVLDDPTEVADRALRMIRGEPIPTLDGGEIRVPVQTLCVHGDTPAALRMVELLRSSCQEAGITVEPFS